MRPRFVDEEDNADRNADLLDSEPVRSSAGFAQLSYRIGQSRDLPKPIGRGGKSGRCERETVDRRGVQAEPSRFRDIPRVCSEDFVGPRFQRVSRGMQPAVLLIRRYKGQRCGSALRALGQVATMEPISSRGSGFWLQCCHICRPVVMSPVGLQQPCVPAPDTDLSRRAVRRRRAWGRHRGRAVSACPRCRDARDRSDQASAARRPVICP